MDRRTFLQAVWAVALLTPLQSASGAEPTDWFHQARWGVMTHYLGAPPSSKGGAELTAEMWNQQVDAFDVAGLADQLASTGAKYLLFTIGQNSGHYCSPNATYDRIVGIKPSKCSRRDLVADLAKALAATEHPADGLPAQRRPGGRPGGPQEARLALGQRRAAGNCPASRSAGGWPSSSGTGRRSSASGRSAGARASRAGGSTAATSPTRCTASTTSRTSPASPGP